MIPLHKRTPPNWTTPAYKLRSVSVDDCGKLLGGRRDSLSLRTKVPVAPDDYRIRWGEVTEKTIDVKQKRTEGHS